MITVPMPTTVAVLHTPTRCQERAINAGNAAWDNVSHIIQYKNVVQSHIINLSAWRAVQIEKDRMGYLYRKLVTISINHYHKSCSKTIKYVN
jgi:hypothetical protein